MTIKSFKMNRPVGERLPHNSICRTVLLPAEKTPGQRVTSPLSELKYKTLKVKSLSIPSIIGTRAGGLMGDEGSGAVVIYKGTRSECSWRFKHELSAGAALSLASSG